MIAEEQQRQEKMPKYDNDPDLNNRHKMRISFDPFDPAS